MLPDTGGASSRFRRLHPSNLAELLVAPAFAVPRKRDAPVAAVNTGAFHDFYRPGVILAEMAMSGGDDALALIDKAFPHARYDLMLVVSNDDIRCGPSELDRATLAAILGSVSAFLDYIAEPGVAARYDLDGARFSVGVNHNRLTADRENGQYFDKRYHLHLNCWPARDLARLEPVPLGSVADRRVRDSLVDPIAFLGPAVMGEALGGLPAGVELLDPQEHAVREGLPLGLKLRLPSWDFLRTDDAVELVRTLHETAENAYRELHVAFTGTEPSGRAWTRPRLLDAAAVARNLSGIGYLSAGSRARLLLLREALSDVAPDEMAGLRADADLASRKLALIGLDYHMGFFSPQVNSVGQPLRDAREVYLYMQFKVLNRHGGGPALGPATIVRMDRASGPVLSGEESALRRAFIEGFAASRVDELEARGAGKRVTSPAREDG